ncbi:hypothetical protein DXG01_016183, partial [Tephrocybe rancida]
EPQRRKNKRRKGGSDDNWEAPPPHVKGKNKGKAKAIPKTKPRPKVRASAAARRKTESEEEDEEEVREEDEEEVGEEDEENELGEDEGGEDEIEVSVLLITWHRKTDLLDEGLNERQAEGIPNILPVKKDSTRDLLLIFSDRCTQEFERPGGKVQEVTGRWCWSCK